MDVPHDPNPVPPDGPTDPAPSTRVVLRRRVRRILIAGLTTAVAVFAVVCVVVFSLQARLIYFPDRDYWTTPDEVGLAYEDLTLTTEDGVSITAWHVPHDQPKGTVLFCHGNAGNIADRVGTLKSFHYLGYNVLIFDYRGYGHSEGKPTETGTYRDAEAAWRYLTETRGESPAGIVLFGRSLGGAVAIDLANRITPAALIAESTFTSVVDIGKRQFPFLPVGLLCKHRYESIGKVSRIACPKLFLHGTEDELVPFENGRRLFEAAAEPKDFIQTPGGHNQGGFEYSREHTDKLQQWLDRTIRSESS